MFTTVFNRNYLNISVFVGILLTLILLVRGIQAQTLLIGHVGKPTQAGVYVFHGGSDGPVCESGRPASSDTGAVFSAALNAAALDFLGDEASETVTFTPGTTAEIIPAAKKDTTIEEVTTGLTKIDDHGNINNSGDDAANLSLGTGGSYVVAPATPIAADGIVAEGYLDATASSIDEKLDGFEFFIFEDAELSGMTIELATASNTYTIQLADRQVNPKTRAGADDPVIGIDLDSLEGWDGTAVIQITFTDDGIVAPRFDPVSDCHTGGETSVKLDAIVIRSELEVTPPPPPPTPVPTLEPTPVPTLQPTPAPGTLIGHVGTPIQSGIYVFHGGSDGPVCEGGEPASSDTGAVFSAALNGDALDFLGDEASETVAFTPGSFAEMSYPEQGDTTIEEVIEGLTRIDDHGNIGNSGDDAANLSLGTGGSYVVALDTPIAADGIVSQGFLDATASSIDEKLDGFEFFIFDDAELSGMIIKLATANNTYTLQIADRQVDPNTDAGADDPVIGIDLDSLDGWDGTAVTQITFTDDGIVMSGGECGIYGDTSVELDAIVIRK